MIVFDGRDIALSVGLTEDGVRYVEDYNLDILRGVRGVNDESQERDYV